MESQLKKQTGNLSHSFKKAGLSGEPSLVMVNSLKHKPEGKTIVPSTRLENLMQALNVSEWNFFQRKEEQQGSGEDFCLQKI